MQYVRPAPVLILLVLVLLLFLPLPPLPVRTVLQAVAAAAALQSIFSGVEAQGHVLSIPMPGHPVGDHEIPDVLATLARMTDLVAAHDVIFVLTDTRERWAALWALRYPCARLCTSVCVCVCARLCASVRVCV